MKNVYVVLNKNMSSMIQKLNNHMVGLMKKIQDVDHKDLIIVDQVETKLLEDKLLMNI